MFRRVLISNRGEIAIRVARAAAALGMESVAVFAPVDSRALHTRVATHAREIGGVEGVAAYLDIDRLVALAVENECDCVHPGYGFLAENAAFAVACQAAGLAFVGPLPATIELFGDKPRARQLADSVGVPIIPGSRAPVRSVTEARGIAADVGYPVMLKAAAGGGGRGIRAVASEADLAAAFARCASEAEAAFGDSALFLERLLTQPRHIEVQVLADTHGHVVHLHERDCSLQLRNQKVIEIAPAPNLDDTVRRRMHDDAVRLVRETGFVNAGTVEFLLDARRGEHFFIECNPRIQVEHTVTEQVTGVDLVEAQFRIAAGDSLESLGIADQDAVGAPRGFAVQSRVVTTGPGTLTAYKEPSGPGVRVDASGYLGYAPPVQFDPLLAKVICHGTDFAAAADRSLRALDEFHIDGLPTNVASLRTMLADPDFRAGSVHTTWVSDNPELREAPPARGRMLELLDSAAGASRNGRATPRPVVTPRSLEVADGQCAVESPQSGAVVEVCVHSGAVVGAGETLIVVTAMKMETAITAPVAGVVVALQPVEIGSDVNAGDVLAVIEPSEHATTVIPKSETWTPLLDDVESLQRLAHARLAPESQDPGVVRQRNRGKLTCRERLDLLFDPGSFREVGSVAGFASYDADGRIADFTPANHVGGWGTVGGCPAIACADDFTSRGGHADGAIGTKAGYLDRLSIELRMPSIRLLDGSSGGGSVAAMVPQQQKSGASSAKESSGAITAGRPRVAGGGGSFLPGHLGSRMYAEQLATVPVVNLLLGSVVGIGAAKAVLGHFSVMVRDISQLFVAGPPVVSHAMGYEISKEELGGWDIHCTNGSVDNLAETEADAIAMTKRFLSYLPGSVYEAPPVLPPNPNDPVTRRDEELFTLIPRKRTTTFDMRRAIRLMADHDSFFEIGSLWGTDQIVGFIRMNGHPLGVIASDSRHVNGGALTADGCDKLTRHLDLCDLFHVPVLNLVDNPGFAVGVEHERTSTIRKGGQWMVAFAQINVPIFTVLMRRSFGVAGNNYATPLGRASMRVAWPAADVGGIPPEGGIEAAYKRQLAEAADPAALRAEINARIESVRGPVGPLNRFQLEEMIDPRDTRRLVCEWVDTAYRLVRQPANLASRPLQYRP